MLTISLAAVTTSTVAYFFGDDLIEFAVGAYVYFTPNGSMIETTLPGGAYTVLADGNLKKNH